MEINLNSLKTLTEANVSMLIASQPDTCHTQIRVRLDGTVYLSTIVGNNQTEGHLFMLSVFIGGNDYVGEAAAKDRRWVRQVRLDIKRNWQKISPDCWQHQGRFQPMRHPGGDG